MVRQMVMTMYKIDLILYLLRRVIAIFDAPRYSLSSVLCKLENDYDTKSKT